ncbi:MAG: hypothetical protein GX552_15270 [Chloroflexi bacterium]|jgi:hypothetical protein|nr:hypothetical protein [Chloroflexota bacterium]
MGIFGRHLLGGFLISASNRATEFGEQLWKKHQVMRPIWTTNVSPLIGRK